MASDNKRKKKADGKRVNIRQSHELKSWAKHFRVPEWAVVLAVWHLNKWEKEPTRSNVLGVFECRGLEVSRAKKAAADVHKRARLRATATKARRGRGAK